MRQLHIKGVDTNQWIGLMTDDSTTWREFALAYAEFLGSRRWHKELAEFHERRFDVYCRVLGVDLSDLSTFDAHQRRLFELGFHSLATRYDSVASPFTGILYTKQPLLGIIRSYEPKFTDLLARERQLYLEAMAEIATHLWGSPNRTVTDADLVPYRVAKEHEPDPNGYW